ncbi:MAG: hypothetical protein WB762_05240 [Candidatus Sulfotelmatobacter sp.]
MNIGPKGRMAVISLGFVLPVQIPAMIGAATGAGAIESRTAEVAGIRLRHLTAGHGPAMILAHVVLI